MRKILGATIVLSAALVAAATPASAKGGTPEPVAGRLVISGSGLGSPITVRGTVLPLEFGPWGNPLRGGTELTRVFQQLGLMPDGGRFGWYVIAPLPSAIGPGYDVLAYFGDNPTNVKGVEPDEATLYPYAPGRPLVHTCYDCLQSNRGLWWTAPRGLFVWLLAHGLPARPVSWPVPSPRPLL